MESAGLGKADVRRWRCGPRDLTEPFECPCQLGVRTLLSGQSGHLSKRSRVQREEGQDLPVQGDGLGGPAEAFREQRGAAEPQFEDALRLSLPLHAPCEDPLELALVSGLRMETL